MTTTLRHSGLPDGLVPFALLDLLEKLRVDLGLQADDLSYLRCAFRLVRRDDFNPGRVCAMWERVAGLADRLQMNVRRITRIERRLETCGLIQRTSAANGKRFGRRGDDGRILSAGGINLAPLIERAPELLARVQRKSVAAQALKDDRNRVNDLIRQIRGLDAPEALAAAQKVFPRLRPSEVQDAEKLHAILAALEAIIVGFSLRSGQTDEAAPSDNSIRPNTNRQTNIKTCRRSGTVEESKRVSVAQAMLLASDGLREAVHLYSQAIEPVGIPSWQAITQAARDRAHVLGISGADWAMAKDQLGEPRTAICLLIADRNADRHDRFAVRNSAAAFIGLVRKNSRDSAVTEALLGELKQHVKESAS